MLGMHGLVMQLKNGVGDLRAEWLLIKREVNGVKRETLRLQVRSQGSRSERSGKLGEGKGGDGRGSCSSGERSMGSTGRGEVTGVRRGLRDQEGLGEGRRGR